jgi:hypothetical protein
MMGLVVPGDTSLGSPPDQTPSLGHGRPRGIWIVCGRPRGFRIFVILDVQKVSFIWLGAVRVVLVITELEVIQAVKQGALPEIHPWE